MGRKSETGVDGLPRFLLFGGSRVFIYLEYRPVKCPGNSAGGRGEEGVTHIPRTLERFHYTSEISPKLKRIKKNFGGF